MSSVPISVDPGAFLKSNNDTKIIPNLKSTIYSTSTDFSPAFDLAKARDTRIYTPTIKSKVIGVRSADHPQDSQQRVHSRSKCGSWPQCIQCQGHSQPEDGKLDFRQNQYSFILKLSVISWWGIVAGDKWYGHGLIAVD